MRILSSSPLFSGSTQKPPTKTAAPNVLFGNDAFSYSSEQPTHQEIQQDIATAIQALEGKEGEIKGTKEGLLPFALARAYNTANPYPYGGLPALKMVLKQADALRENPDKLEEFQRKLEAVSLSFANWAEHEKKANCYIEKQVDVNLMTDLADSLGTLSKNIEDKNYPQTLEEIRAFERAFLKKTNAYISRKMNDNLLQRANDYLPQATKEEQKIIPRKRKRDEN
jgi:hypothetical protein